MEDRFLPLPTVTYRYLPLPTATYRSTDPGLMEDQPLLPMIFSMFRIFTARPTPPPPPPARRHECGYSGIIVQRCEARGCVFDATVPHSPWCYALNHTRAPLKVDHAHGGEL